MRQIREELMSEVVSTVNSWLQTVRGELGERLEGYEESMGSTRKQFGELAERMTKEEQHLGYLYRQTKEIVEERIKERKEEKCESLGLRTHTTGPPHPPEGTRLQLGPDSE